MKHVFYECGGKCQEDGHCQYCDGGLAWCTTCGGAEGSLTTDCPGRKITADEEDAIYKTGLLDYRDGQGWVNPACDDLFGRPTYAWHQLRYPSAYKIQITPPPPTRPLQTYCEICGGQQFDTPGGVCCPSGHGGAPARASYAGCPNPMCEYPDCRCGRMTK